MKKNVKNYFVAISIIIVLIAGITCIKYRNAIYVWYLGDVQSIYKQAEGYYRQNRMEEAAGLYSKLVRIDSASNSQYILGDIYYQGKLGEVNYKKALKLFMKSAEGGNAKAQNNLGFMYTYGIGTEMDYSKAKNYLNMAVAQGYSQAQVGLGSLYRHGWGVTKSYTEAFKLYKRAAAHNNTDGMNRGICIRLVMEHLQM